MGDPSHAAPDLQSVLDTQKSNALKENHAGQNGTNIDNHHAPCNGEESFLELLSSEGGVPFSTKLPPEQNGYHVEMEEGETESKRLEPHKESDAAQVDMSSLDQNGSISPSSLEAKEEGLNWDNASGCNPVHTDSQEGRQGGNTEETNAQAPANILHEGAVVDQGYPRTLDSSNEGLICASTEGQNIVSNNALDVNTKRGDEDDESSRTVIDNENVEGIYYEEEKNGFGKEPKRPDKSLIESATQPCIPTESSPENSKQPPAAHSVNEIKQLENESTNKSGEKLEAPLARGNMHNAIQNGENMNEGEWLDQGHGVVMVISNDMEGWQHFDNPVTITPTNQNQSLQPWETLLDDGFDGGVREIVNQPLQLAIAPSPFEEDKFGLASPGNPFMEELGRVSSFCEADGFAQSGYMPSANQLSQSLEGSSSFQLREGQIHDASGNSHVSSVFPAIDGETKAVQPESVHEHGSNHNWQLPTSRKSLASFDAMEPFEAPSFMSLVDPKSQALFEVSMPTFQASSMTDRQGNSEEKWVANFDLMAPSTQEIKRSSSIPRSGGEVSGQQTAGQSFSFATSQGRERDPPQAQGTNSGFSPPKFSPIVQKVVDKVRTTPAVANGVINSVRQAMSPKVSEKKLGSKSLLTRCLCW